MGKDTEIKIIENFQKPPKSIKCLLVLCFFVLPFLIIYPMVSIFRLCYDGFTLQNQVVLLQKKAILDDSQTIIMILEQIKNIQMDLMKLKQLEYQQIYQQMVQGIENDQGNQAGQEYQAVDHKENQDDQDDQAGVEDQNDKNEEKDNSNEDWYDYGDGKNGNTGLKRKREIRDYNESSVEKDLKRINNNETEDKYSPEKGSIDKSSGEKWSTEMSSLEKSSESSSKEKNLGGSHRHYSTRKPHYHRKHRKSRIGSAERFFTETHSTTSTPIQVRQSRTKPTQLNGIDKALWLHNQKFQQHMSPLKDTITKEEALRKGYGKFLEDISYDLESSREHKPDALTYNMIMIHFSADTSHYSRERDPHYFGNGRMQIKSEVYKDWKPAHWTQGVGMSRYFHLYQGHVTVSTTGIYLIYAQIQYSNVQEVNGFSVFRNNKEVVAQCVTTSTHENKHEIKSNTCGISTTILLQSNDSVCIKDLHHGRYVVLTPEKSYFGLVLLSPFKN